MDLKKAILDTFGKERAALYEAEIRHLVEKGYSERDLGRFLERYALPTGVFYALSSFMRTNLSVEEMEESEVFLFNSAPTLVTEISERVPANGRLLDFGCGRGLTSCALALGGFEVHGVDVSDEALDVAKKLVDTLRCRATFHLIEQCELPFTDGYFDAVVSHWTFHEVQKELQPKAVAELYRTLRSKGYAFIVDQEEVASLETIRSLMDEHDFALEVEKRLAQVYDHGRVSKAVMLVYRKDTCALRRQ